MTSENFTTALKAQMLGQTEAVPTSALTRMWRTGRSAVGVGSALLRGHKGDDMDPAAIAALVTRLGGLKGVAMKAGQMLGYIDTSVPPELQAMLSLLQTAAPGTDFAGVEATLRAALGERADPLLAGIDRTPVAVASVGQVHHARLADGRELAVKVRHPGIEAALAADFRSAGVGKLFAALSGAASIRECIEEAREAFTGECDFLGEAAHQQHFAHIFRDDPVLVIPEVLPELCATPVLVTRWTPGRSLATFLAGDPTQAERDAVGAALFRFWLRSFYRDGLFHADPHPGNFAFLPDGRIVLYDFGCVRRFDPALRRGFARLAAATRDNDEDGLLAAITAIGGHAPKDRSGRAHVRTLLRAFFAPLLTPGKRRVAPDASIAGRGAMQDKRAIINLQLPGRMLFLFRLRFGLYAVLSRLQAEVDWCGLESAWAREA
jgi:predicted unusual protein kinase regulating ubiquinone biosynthesis (AarF/ABC1/UbiB family)